MLDYMRNTLSGILYMVRIKPGIYIMYYVLIILKLIY